MKICVINDPHLDEHTPVSRLDDYTISTFVMFEEIFKIEADMFVINGDLFNDPSPSREFLNLVLDFFSTYRDRNIYLIIGNHDLVNASVVNFPKSPACALISAGIMKQFAVPIKVGAVNLIPLNYSDGCGTVSMHATADFNICFGHKYFQYGKDLENLKPEHLKGIDLCFLGHDHNQYNDEFVNAGDTRLVRHGNINRMTSASEDRKRKNVYVALLEFGADGTWSEVSLIELKSASTQIFNEAYIEAKSDIRKAKKEAVNMSEIFNVKDTKLESIESVVEDADFPDLHKQEFFRILNKVKSNIKEAIVYES